MMNIKKSLLLLRRYLGSYFTYRCVSCEKYVRGCCLCKECGSKIFPITEKYENAAFGYYYDGPAREVMLRYKFGKDSDFCKDALCSWLCEAYNKFEDEKFDFAVCVPSFSKKETRLSVLAKEFCLEKDILFIPDVLKKIRQTEKQHKLSGDERRKNLIGAFEAENSVCGKTVLLIDDIYTTGSTVTECSKALYAKGAAKVCVLAIFKTR